MAFLKSKAFRICFSYFKSFFFVALYCILALSIALIFNLSGFMGTFIANIMMVFICTGQFIDLRNKNKDSDFLKPRFKLNWSTFFFVFVSLIVFTIFAFFSMSWITRITVDTNMTSRSDSYISAIQSYGWFFYVFATCIISPVAEEFVYRLFVYNNCRSTTGIVPATIFTSLLFGASHMTFGHLIIGSLFSVFLICVYELSGRKLWLCILFHVIYNTLAMFVPGEWFVQESAFSILSIIFVLIICVFLLIYVITKGKKTVSSDNRQLTQNKNNKQNKLRKR